MNSQILLCKNIKMDKDYNNVLSYSESAMLSLCRENAIAIDDTYSFIRKNKNSISTHFSYSQCLQANYIAFQNTDYSGKWFFAWIDEIIYKNDLTTEIIYTVDEWSTWFDYWQKKKCFIVRQHVNDDSIGSNTVDEGISIGEYVAIDSTADLIYDIYDRENETIRNHYIAMETNYVPIPDTSPDSTAPVGAQFDGVNVVNSILTGSRYVFFYMNSANLGESIRNISRFISRVNKDGHISDIRNLFAVANNLVNPNDIDTYEASVNNYSDYQNGLFTWYSLNKNIYTPHQYEFTVTKNRSFSEIGYNNVKNNKLYCYPYNYLMVSNNNGSSNIYKYEDFYSQDCIFLNQVALCIGCQGRLIPLDYKRIPFNDGESIPLAKYPTFSWSSDAYTNWLTQNAVNLKTEFVEIGMSGVEQSANLVTGNETNLTSTAGRFFNLYDRFRKAELLPNIVGGNSTGDLSYSGGSMGYRYYKLCAKAEYLEKLDNWFSRFGYKINNIETPNITGRRNWNYLEIGAVDDIGYGQVPSSSMETINNICRKGTTIWHNHTNLGDFSLDNSIVV